MKLKTVLGPDHKALLPINHSIEDIFLVSFPKSGNTWLRFLIANAIRTKYQIEREVNFFSIHDLIPDVHISRRMLPQGAFGRSDIPRIIKSHGEFNPHYHRVILLVRDPSDVVVSYYYFLRNYQYIPMSWSLSEFVRNAETGIQAWTHHTQSWLQSQRIGQILRVFSYESLKQDTEQQLFEVMLLLGFRLSEAEVAQAVALSSKEAMSASEEKHVSNQLVKNQETAFVRKRETSHRERLSDSDKAYIYEKTQAVVAEMKVQWF